MDSVVISLQEYSPLVGSYIKIYLWQKVRKINESRKQLGSKLDTIL